MRATLIELSDNALNIAIVSGVLQGIELTPTLLPKQKEAILDARKALKKIKELNEYLICHIKVNENMRNPNGPSVEQIDDWSDALLEQHIAEQQAKESKAVREAKCTICKTAWVDVMGGEDTCKECKVA